MCVYMCVHVYFVGCHIGRAAFARNTLGTRSRFYCPARTFSTKLASTPSSDTVARTALYSPNKRIEGTQRLNFTAWAISTRECGIEKDRRSLSAYSLQRVLLSNASECVCVCMRTHTCAGLCDPPAVAYRFYYTYPGYTRVVFLLNEFALPSVRPSVRVHLQARRRAHCAGTRTTR